ncbi:PmbA protein [Persephonella hydrogeniphila]|uniref:PmbA protein n=1 Tax=Persephonella hydrogeniphila TaxID=198703 RepID=A0A285N2T6_9AQUI|nr:TldD/PmbA family protein [Persephonella hydrogeniphila]SNZ03117.1 PmbA protein [Persephonella hydrogeniphila]
MEINQILKEVKDLLSKYKWEIYISEISKLKSKSKDFEIESITKSREYGLSVRVLKDGKSGFSYTSDPTPQNIRKSIEKALELLKISTPDENLSFQKPVNTEKVEYYDSYASEVLDSDEKILKAIEIERSIKTKDIRIKNVRECSFSETIFKYSLINSEGVNTTEKGTIYTAFASAVAEERGDTQIAWDFIQSRFLKDLDIEFLADEIVSNAVSLLGATPTETKSIPVLFPPYAFSQILEAFYPAFSGDYLIKGKSYFEDKKDTPVACSDLSIVDNGRLAKGIMTRSFDDEGTPTQKTVLVEKGIFKNFIHNLYTSSVSGEKPTGNGYRSSFKDSTSVKPSNFYVESGEGIKIKNDTFKVIEMLGLHTSNPVTGDFSVGVSGLIINEKGIVKPVRGVTLTGNFFEIIKNIVQIGNDLRFYGGFGSPSVLVKEMVIGGI